MFPVNESLNRFYCVDQYFGQKFDECPFQNKCYKGESTKKGKKAEY